MAERDDWRVISAFSGISVLCIDSYNTNKYNVLCWKMNTQNNSNLIHVPKSKFVPSI